MAHNISDLSVLSDFRSLFGEQGNRCAGEDDGWDSVVTTPSRTPFRAAKKREAPLPPLFNSPTASHHGVYSPAYRPPTYAELVRTSPQIGQPLQLGESAPIRGNVHPRESSWQQWVEPSPARRKNPWKMVAIAVISGLMMGGGVLAGVLCLGGQDFDVGPDPSVISVEADTDDVAVAVTVLPPRVEIPETEPVRELEHAKPVRRVKKRVTRRRARRAGRATVEVDDILAAGAGRKLKKRGRRGTVDAILSAGAKGATDDDEASDADKIALMNSVY